jgi:hypothetical protein
VPAGGPAVTAEPERFTHKNPDTPVRSASATKHEPDPKLNDSSRLFEYVRQSLEAQRERGTSPLNASADVETSIEIDSASDPSGDKRDPYKPCRRGVRKGVLPPC